MSKFELIAAECADHDITKLTELLGVSPSGFYSWVDRQRRRELTPRQQRRRDLEVKILAHWQASTRTYGSPRITADLHAEGVAVSENTVAKIMAEMGIEPPRICRRLSNLWRIESMAAPRKYSVELKERATRMAVEARRDPATRPGALKRIGDQLGVHPEALRTWVKQAEIDGGVRPGTTTSDAERIAQLERENRELRRANTILKQASAFFSAEIDRPQR